MLQVFPEASDETDLDKTERPVGGGADLVVWLRVRRELTAALRAPPLLRRGDKRSADTVATSLWHDEPSLEVRDPIAVATLSVRANRQLGEADRTSCPVLGEEDGERFPGIAAKEPVDRLTVVGLGAFGPEGVAELKPRGRVALLRGSNGDH